MENDTNVDIILLNYLNKNGVVRRKILREEVSKLVERSPITIDKKLNKLKKEKKIDFLKGDELIPFGLLDVDINASYIVSKEYLKVKNHIDNVFLDFQKEKDEKLKTLALIEINSHNGYNFIPNQLNQLFDVIDSDNDDLARFAMMVIYQHMQKGIIPSDKKNFLKKLKSALKKYCGDCKENKNLRTEIIIFLGIFEDEIVIDQIIDDIRNGRINDEFRNSYRHRFTAKIIDDNREKLYSFEKELIKEGKISESSFLRYIRHEARKHLYPEEYQDEFIEYLDEDGKTKRVKVI